MMLASSLFLPYIKDPLPHLGTQTGWGKVSKGENCILKYLNECRNAWTPWHKFPLLLVLTQLRIL